MYIHMYIHILNFIILSSYSSSLNKNLLHKILCINVGQCNFFSTVLRKIMICIERKRHSTAYTNVRQFVIYSHSHGHENCEQPQNGTNERKMFRNLILLKSIFIANDSIFYFIFFLVHNLIAIKLLQIPQKVFI